MSDCKDRDGYQWWVEDRFIRIVALAWSEPVTLLGINCTDLES